MIHKLSMKGGKVVIGKIQCGKKKKEKNCQDKGEEVELKFY